MHWILFRVPVPVGIFQRTCDLVRRGQEELVETFIAELEHARDRPWYDVAQAQLSPLFIDRELEESVCDLLRDEEAPERCLSILSIEDWPPALPLVASAPHDMIATFGKLGNFYVPRDSTERLLKDYRRMCRRLDRKLLEQRWQCFGQFLPSLDEYVEFIPMGLREARDSGEGLLAVQAEAW